MKGIEKMNQVIRWILFRRQYEKILKVIMTLVLICSCFYLAISLFMNHLIINDMVPTVVKSTAVTNAFRRYLSKCLSMMNMDESQSQALVSSLQQDEKTQELVNDILILFK